MSLDVYLTVLPTEPECVFSANITHNLGAMAEEAGIYQHCWHPEKIGIRKAGQLIQPLTTAIQQMRADPNRYKRHDAPNGWGLYVNFLPWRETYLEACIINPNAYVQVSR